MSEFGFSGNVPHLDGNVDGQGGSIGGKAVWTAAEAAAHLNRPQLDTEFTTGAGWSNAGDDARPASGDPAQLRFGFHSQATMDASAYASVPDMDEYAGFQPFSAAQEEAARKAILLWNDLIALDIVETAADQADITFGNYDNKPGTQGYAYLPYDYAPPEPEFAGDVWINVEQDDNLELDNGYYGLITLVHETGHALGLMHPGDYDAGEAGPINYPNSAEYYQDSRQYTSMSYFNADFTGAGHVDWSRFVWVYGQTPLLHDILAIQAIYGADPTTRTGATVYGFHGNAGRDVFDFSVNPMPVISIYDAQGIDTLDFSGWDTPSKIDLNPGAFSSGGGSGVVPLEDLKAAGFLPADYSQAQYDALRAAHNALDGMLHDNISIAYGTIIENAVGGGGNDTIIGNAVSNILIGGGGNDTISGGSQIDFLYGESGNDTLDGGSGFDELYGGAGSDTLLGGANGKDRLDGGTGVDSMSGGTDNDLYVVDNVADVVIEAGGGGSDTIESSVTYSLPANVESLYLTGAAPIDGYGHGGANKLVGNAGWNFLSGGGGGDTIDGAAGNDRIYGGDGSDVLKGGSGKDGFYFNTAPGSANVDRILDFSVPNDTLYLARYVFTRLSPGTLSEAAFHQGAAAADAGDRIIYDQAGGRIFYDLDGSGTGKAILFATVNAGTPLTHADFIVYG